MTKFHGEFSASLRHRSVLAMKVRQNDTAPREQPRIAWHSIWDAGESTLPWARAECVPGTGWVSVPSETARHALSPMDGRNVPFRGRFLQHRARAGHPAQSAPDGRDHHSQLWQSRHCPDFLTSSEKFRLVQPDPVGPRSAHQKTVEYLLPGVDLRRFDPARSRPKNPAKSSNGAQDWTRIAGHAIENK